MYHFAEIAELLCHSILSVQVCQGCDLHMISKLCLHGSTQFHPVCSFPQQQLISASKPSTCPGNVCSASGHLFCNQPEHNVGNICMMGLTRQDMLCYWLECVGLVFSCLIQCKCRRNHVCKMVLVKHYSHVSRNGLGVQWLPVTGLQSHTMYDIHSLSHQIRHLWLRLLVAAVCWPCFTRTITMT